MSMLNLNGSTIRKSLLGLGLIAGLASPALANSTIAVGDDGPNAKVTTPSVAQTQMGEETIAPAQALAPLTGYNVLSSDGVALGTVIHADMNGTANTLDHFTFATEDGRHIQVGTELVGTVGEGEVSIAISAAEVERLATEPVTTLGLLGGPALPAEDSDYQSATAPEALPTASQVDG